MVCRHLSLYPALLETSAGWISPVHVAGEWFAVTGAKHTSRHRFGVVVAIAQVKNDHAYVGRGDWLPGLNVLGVCPVGDESNAPEVVLLPRRSVMRIVPAHEEVRTPPLSHAPH